MNKLKKLFFVQIVTGGIIGTFLMLSGLYFTSQLVHSSQQNHLNFIEKLTYSHLMIDPSILSKQLNSSINFEYLAIKSADGHTLYQFNKHSSELPILTTVLLLSGLHTKPIEFIPNKGDLTIKFHSSYEEVLNPALWLLLLLFLLPLVFVIVNFMLFKSAMNQVFVGTSNQIANLVNRFIDDQSLTDITEFDNLPKQLAPVKKAIQRLSAFFASTMQQHEQSTATLKIEAYKDTLTNLPNRNRFVDYFDMEINNPEKQNQFGVLILVRATELQNINHSKGYEFGDSYIKSISAMLTKAIGTYSQSSLYRLNGSDFGILIPSITANESDIIAQNIQSRFNEYMRISELNSVGSMGIVTYDSSNMLGELLAAADTAISLAQAKRANSWHLHKKSNMTHSSASSFGNQNWRQLIDDVINHSKVDLLFQPIKNTHKNNNSYVELLARFSTDNDQVLPTASFLAMAEKLNRVVEIDRLIVSKALELIKTYNSTNLSFGINLTPSAIHDEEFMIWLERKLLKESEVATKLIFEISEYGMQQNIDSSRRFIDIIHRTGARITVEKFGIGITSFKFFKELKPDFIKLDSSYSRDIKNEKNNQYFVKMIVDLSHRIGVNVLAECVEAQEEKSALEKLMVDGCQGYFIGKPSASLV